VVGTDVVKDVKAVRTKASQAGFLSWMQESQMKIARDGAKEDRATRQS
jgi:hypothetical protein